MERERGQNDIRTDVFTILIGLDYACVEQASFLDYCILKLLCIFHFQGLCNF
jgi:hypothetical protein